jgi:pimeloyl-ACP methyl ester carboxylesterase
MIVVVDSPKSLVAAEPEAYSLPVSFQYYDWPGDDNAQLKQSPNVSYLYDSPTPIPTPTATATPMATPTVIPTATPVASPTPTATPTATAGPANIVATARAIPVDLLTNANSNAGVDTPLEPLTDATRLHDSQPTILGGLVADGVTPLLIETSALSTPSQPVSYNIKATITGGHLNADDSTNGGLTSHLKVLQFPVRGNPNFVNGTSLVLSAAHPNGFAYITGINGEDVIFNPGSKELLVSLTIAPAGFSDPHSTIQFRIRRPPVVLVHGFNSDARTWSGAGGDFLDSLQNAYPSDFVIPINYGVNFVSKDPDAENRTGSLFTLVQELNVALPKTGQGGIFSDWAMTRYDLVCHSQGGVLARMLCVANSTAFGITPFKNMTNGWRGRFRRIVTIGAPQNGSTVEYYASKVLDNLHLDPNFLSALIRSVVATTLQPKFNPFGSEIKKLNDPVNLVDSDAKFHAVVGAVSNSCNGLAAFFLDDSIKSAAVIPRGSDGVVDFDSARSEYAGGAVYSVPVPTSHSSPEWIFNVSKGSTETQSGMVAQHVIDVLVQPPTAFAPFKLPRLLGINEQSAIDKVVPGVKVSGTISVRTSGVYRQPVPDGSSAALHIDLAVLLDSTEPMQGQPTWLAEVYGPDGVSAEGLLIQQDPDNPTMATLYFSSAIQGDVVVHCSYKSASGRLVVAAPVVVFSTAGDTSLKSISLEPNNPVVTVGDKFSLQIWGTYSDNSVAQLYESAGAPAHITSSNSSVIGAGPDNQLAAKSLGTSTITVSFRGLTTQAVVTSVGGVVPPVFPTIQLANISTRLAVQTADRVLIGGFIVAGTQPKRVIVRGIGSSLPLAGALADPVLELYDGAGQLLESNDNWGDSANKQAIIDTGIPPANSLEAAIVRTLPAGNSAYTVILRGTNGGTGIGVVEAYDLDNTVDSRLANISTRGFVNTGDNVMIGGTIVVGSATTNVLVRAIGPSLANGGVSNALEDPILELFDGNGVLMAVNDNWIDTQEAQIVATAIPPSDNRESAILATLAPGQYTAVVRGKNHSTGVALAEAYQLQ